MGKGRKGEERNGTKIDWTGRAVSEISAESPTATSGSRNAQIIIREMRMLQNNLNIWSDTLFFHPKSPIIMKRFLLLVAVAFALFNATQSASAQDDFELQNKNSHYYFSTTVGGAYAEIMVESGIPAMLVGRDFYEKVLKNSGLPFEPSESKIRLLNNVYKIPFRAKGKVRVGNLVFDGPVFILDDFSGISMPIQYLKVEDAKKTFVALDFQEKTMRVSGQKPGISGEKFKLSIDKKMGFPIVRSALKMSAEEGNATLKGDFIVDFGNPELLFLMKHKKVEKAIQSGKLELIDVLSGQTFEVVGSAFRTENVTICGRSFEGKSIVVTDKMPAIEQLGFLGIPFFKKTVVFDFSGGVMMVQ